MNISTQIKYLVWLYLFLLIWEGALRKWVLPGWSNQLLICRDPVVILIYILAIKRFPWQKEVLPVMLVIAAMSFFTTMLGSRFDSVVALYGFRVNFLHLPLIFVMPCYLHRGDVVQMGKWIMIFSIPIVWMMALQFDGNIDSSWNVGVGGGIGGQLKAAVGDKVRGSGPFSFITGPVLFFPLAACFILNAITYRKQAGLMLTLLAGALCMLAIPVAISRSLLMGMVVTGGCYALLTLLRPQLAGKGLRAVTVLGLLFLAVGATDLFKESSVYLGQRWEGATESGGGFWVNIVGRLVSEMTFPLSYLYSIPVFGVGLGVGTNVGSRLLTGVNTFLLPEGEWGRIAFESGPYLGSAIILLRVSVAVITFRRSLKSFRSGDILPMLLWSAFVLNMVSGQWGPPTSQGFAAFGGGMVLAACRRSPGRHGLVSRNFRAVVQEEVREEFLVETVAGDHEPSAVARRLSGGGN